MVDGIKVNYFDSKITLEALDYSSGVENLPLKRTGNLFLIEAQIDSVKGNFILDLGAPYLVLNSTYFRDYQKDTLFYAGSLNTVSDYVRRTKVDSLRFGSIKYSGIQADVTDLAAIENKRGQKILGLLGVALFEEFIIELNCSAQQLKIHTNAKTVSIDPLQLKFKERFNMVDKAILLSLEINGVDLNFSIDTGAETNLLNNNLPSEVYSDMRILKNSVVRDANGRATEVLMTYLSGMKIGKTQLDGAQTLILNLGSISKAYGKEIDGMLGYPFFMSNAVVINFKKKTVYMYNLIPKNQ